MWTGVGRRLQLLTDVDGFRTRMVTVLEVPSMATDTGGPVWEEALPFRTWSDLALPVLHWWQSVAPGDNGTDAGTRS